MTLTVSISEFRNNLAQYLERVAKGDNLLVRDEKKDISVAQITPVQSFDPEAFQRALEAAAGSITAKNHPEWRTKKDIVKWLERERKAAQRHF